MDYSISVSYTHLDVYKRQGMAFEYPLFQENIWKVGPIGVDKQLEKVLLSQYIYIEYLEDVLVYDEKIQGSRGFYNQRRRWLANQFSSLMSGITQLPIALLKGNWDYCDKLFQWAMPCLLYTSPYALYRHYEQNR